MGKSGYDPVSEVSAALVHEQSRQPIASPAEELVATESEDRGVLWAALVLQFGRRGLSKEMAAACACDVFEVIKFLDREACENVADVMARVPVAMSDERLMWLEAVSQVFEWPDTKAASWALLFAHGQPPIGVDSMRKMAEGRAMSPENVNNMVDEFQRIFGLPRTRLQKSAAAIGSYQRTNGAK